MDMQQITESARPVFKAYAIDKAILFGSFATGRSSRRSDVDLILVAQSEKRFFDRYEGILRDLHQAIKGCSVDVLIYTQDELLRIAHRPFIARALREGKVIYESGSIAH